MQYPNISKFLLIVLILFSACSSDEIVNNNNSGVIIDTSTFTYPFTNGSIWNYQRIYSIENIRPDSIIHYFNELLTFGNGYISILYDTSINNISVKCFFEKYTEYFQNDSNTWYSRNYFGNYDTALICYAYRFTGGGSGMPFGLNQGLQFKKNNLTFRSIKDIFRYFDYGIINRPFIDTLIILNPPLTSLKYPIVTGKQWLFKNIPELSPIYKKYISFVTICGAGECTSCMKTQRDWTVFNDDFFYDYYSKFGQLRRDYLFKDMILINEYGDTLGFFDSRDVYNVTSYNIASP
jgi:hypothetical protein